MSVVAIAVDVEDLVFSYVCASIYLMGRNCAYHAICIRRYPADPLEEALVDSVVDRIRDVGSAIDTMLFDKDGGAIKDQATVEAVLDEQLEYYWVFTLTQVSTFIVFCFVGSTRLCSKSSFPILLPCLHNSLFCGLRVSTD